MEFFDVILGQRAHRRLRPEPVSDELIEQILTAATHAPSAENRQPWAFVVVRDTANRRALGDLATSAWEGAGREWSKPILPPAFFDDVDDWATGGLADAPVHIVVCGDTAACPEPMLASSVYPAVQNLLLAAGAIGLGSLFSTLALVNVPAVRELLALPDFVVPMALVPVGRPARQLGPPRRIPAAQKMRRERWTESW